MKGFFKWFKSGTRMKRWMFIILIGIICLCYGASQIIAQQTLSILEVIKVSAIFVLGFVLVVVGLVYSQKRVLELLIEETDERINNKKDVNINSLIFNKKIYNEGPNVVVIGGGNGLNTVLKGLKKYTNNITAIVEMSGYKNEYTLDGIISLAKDENEMKRIINTQINENMNFGELYLKIMQSNYENNLIAMERMGQILNITGKILPVTLDEMKICAELQDGTIVENEKDIPDAVMNKVTRISRIYLSPSNCKTSPKIIDAIMDADAIIIGPGSLYTNVIPNLLIKNIAKAIAESKAKKVYISNIMTEPGQTDDFSLYDHVKAILDHARNNVIDYCIYDTGEIVPEYIKKYNKQGSDLVEQDIKKVKSLGIKVIQRNFSVVNGESIRHDPEMIADSVIQLICDDMIFKDMQNGPQYINMNKKLQKSNKKRKITEKERIKKERALKKKGKRIKDTRKSKFAAKYNERIKSIQSSEEVRKEKLKSINKD